MWCSGSRDEVGQTHRTFRGLIGQVKDTDLNTGEMDFICWGRSEWDAFQKDDPGFHV